MKKRLLFVFMICFTLLYVVGCRDNYQHVKSRSERKADAVLDNKKRSKAKTIVVYFSRSGENYNVGDVSVGNTAMIASYIVDALKADSFEIVPVNSYSNDYEIVAEQAKKEQEEKARPKIKNRLDNLNQYDTIFLGYPIWWGDMPMIVYSFLEQYDLSSKTVIPFNTHEGSGSAGTYETIKNKLNKSKVITDGLTLQGSIAREEEGRSKTLKWLEKLGYIEIN